MKHYPALLFIICIFGLFACSGGDEPQRDTDDSGNGNPSPVTNLDELIGVWEGETDVTADVEAMLGYPLNEPVIAEYYIAINAYGEGREYIYMGNMPGFSQNCYVAVDQQIDIVHLENNRFIIDGMEEVTINQTHNSIIVSSNGLPLEWQSTTYTETYLTSNICEDFLANKNIFQKSEVFDF